MEDSGAGEQGTSVGWHRKALGLGQSTASDVSRLKVTCAVKNLALIYSFSFQSRSLPVTLLVTIQVNQLLHFLSSPRERELKRHRCYDLKSALGTTMLQSPFLPLSCSSQTPP